MLSFFFFFCTPTNVQFNCHVIVWRQRPDVATDSGTERRSCFQRCQTLRTKKLSIAEYPAPFVEQQTLNSVQWRLLLRREQFDASATSMRARQSRDSQRPTKQRLRTRQRLSFSISLLPFALPERLWGYRNLFLLGLGSSYIYTSVLHLPQCFHFAVLLLNMRRLSASQVAQNMAHWLIS